MLAKQGLINPAHLRVVIVTRADCAWVVASQLWLPYFSSVSGWLSCQSDCPNVEQLEISPGGLVLGWVCGFVPPSQMHFSQRGTEKCVSSSCAAFTQSRLMWVLAGKQLFGWRLEAEGTSVSGGFNIWLDRADLSFHPWQPWRAVPEHAN